jgi:alpha-L-rhamnosidase
VFFRLKKEVTIRFTDIGLDECSGTVPVDDGVIELQWKHADNQIHYSLNVPRDFAVKVENLTSFELVKNESH